VSGVSGEAPAPITSWAAEADLGVAPPCVGLVWEAAEQQDDGATLSSG
jgi:hypothetical protein